MKKFALLLLGLSLFLGACRSAEKVSYLEFVISDNPELIKAQEASVVKLRLEPDYEKRTFKATYSRDFSAKNQQDELAEGTLGGENFENFEMSVRLVGEYDPKTVEQVAGVPNFIVQMAKADGTMKSMEVVDNSVSENEIAEELRTFYMEWATLLTEDEQV